MTGFYALSIRKQLCLMAVIVALPAAGIIIYEGLDKRHEDIEEARHDIQKLADEIASEQKNRVAGAQQLTSALAQLPEIRSHSTAKVQSILAEIHKINPQYLNIYLADRTGTMWASAVPSTAPVSLSDRRHFLHARNTGQFSSGEYMVGRLLGKPTLSFAYPYKDQKGEFAGAIVVNFDFEHFRNLLERAKLPTGSSYLITDHKGVILSRGIRPAELVGKQIKPERLRQMQEGPDRGTYIGPGTDGVERFSGYRKLSLDGEQTSYMYVIAGIPVKETVAKANRTLFLSLALMFPFMMIAFFFVWIIGKRSIIDRIATLQAASQRLAGGDLQTRVHHLVQGGELGELGEAFDALATSLARDSAARKQAEEAQRASERFLRTIIDTEPECVKLLAVDGSLLMMNQAGLAMFEADSFEQVAGKSVFPLVASEYRDAFETLTREVFRGKEGSLAFELVGLKGRRLWLDTHAVPFRDDHGEIASLLAIIRDVTERKQAEMKIVALNSELATHAAELEAANKELEAFSYTVSHDLRTPLTRISLCCEVIRELMGDRHEGHWQSYLDDISIETARMGQLITALLDLSHISRRELHWESVDLTEMANVTAAELQLNQPDRRATFVIAPGVSAFGDADLLRIVLQNLLSNAWKYTGTKEPAVIEFGITESAGERTYFVRDNGVGFDMNDADKLFAPFQRLHGKEEFAGHGIGLATVHRIILRHHGRIWAEGAPGKGATFHFTL
jgi:PAS domain S-box-containing protein